MLQAGNWTKTTKNKRILPAEQRANPWPFPKKDSLTQKHSNVQDNNDITKQSLSSIPSIKVHSHFGNVFVKPSTVFVLLTLLLLFLAQKEKFSHKFPFTCVFVTFRRYKITEVKMPKFSFI